MNAPILWLAAGLACAPTGTPTEFPVDAARPTPGRIVAVTVYQGQALVTREVAVPEGEGTFELVVSPLPATTVAGSLAAEGGEGLRVLATRFRSRTVRDDARAEVRAKEDEVRQLEADSDRLRRANEVQSEDLQLLHQLEGFAGRTVQSLTMKGGVEDRAVINLSRFIMKTRAARSEAQGEIDRRLKASGAAANLARKQLGELSTTREHVVRDAVLVVRKTRPGPAAVQLAHLVDSATWVPQYRVRWTAADAPVRLDNLAAVAQQTGEDWSNVRLALSTARPATDAAPPDLLPLKMEVAGAGGPDPVESRDEPSQRIRAALSQQIVMAFPNDTPLGDFLKYVRQASSGPGLPDGIPIYVDPQGLQDADKTLASTINLDLRGLPLRTTLRLALAQLNLFYYVRDGLLSITAETSDNLAELGMAGGMGGTGGGMGGGMGGMGGGLALEQAQASGVVLNRRAAGVQAEELQVGDGLAGDAALPGAIEDGPSVSFAVAEPVDVPTRPEPQLFEVGRAELPADSFAKAVPVLTPRVYRQAKLTNSASFVLLPGDATVYRGDEFVGRMKLPLVATGETFVVGLGVDPQLQVARRLVRKARTVQGGNQLLTFEFRTSLRNYGANPVRLQLWDRLPVPEGEAVAVHLVRTSTGLSEDATYQRTGRPDNLLRWDLDVPAGTIGDRPLAVDYEFRIEYARDLPAPRFLSGGLGEDPIGGPAVMGGQGGGFRSVEPGAATVPGGR